jgi:hypothetical protein
MSRVMIFAVLLLATCSANAQLRPLARTLATVSDPSMVVMDRGAKLEVFPTRRAVSQVDEASHRLVRRIAVTSATTAFDSGHMGVVFNYARQQQGYISGEISFKVKSGQKFSESASRYPGLKLVVPPSMYVVNAHTPAEFIGILKDLQNRSDLEWVEPTVSYQDSQ